MFSIIIKIFSLTQCEICEDRRDSHILVRNDQRTTHHKTWIDLSHNIIYRGIDDS